MASTLHLGISRGTTFGPVLIYAKDADGAAVPLAGWKAYAEVRKEPGSELLIDLAPVIAADDADGLITLPAIAPGATAAMSSIVAQWDLILEDPDGNRTEPILAGRFPINLPITQPA